jgi:hypothetical protein
MTKKAGETRQLPGGAMARDRVRKDEAEALDQALRSLFQSLQAKALPESLRPDSPSNLLDQLLAASSRAGLGKA